jgi:hypothetical protein
MKKENLEYLSIPLIGVSGVETLRICPHEFHDPYMLTIELPKSVLKKKKLHLRRDMFSAKISGKIRP